MSRDLLGRFEKGVCGNPLGRPRKTKRTMRSINHEAEFIDATEQEFPVKIGGKAQKKRAIDLILAQLVRKALEGDTRCTLKVIELRENYVNRDADKRSELAKTYFDARRRFQRNPEDHTDEFREALEEAARHLNS